MSKPQLYIRPTRLSTSSAREEKIASHIKLREEEEKLWDTYSSLDELAVKITNMNLPTGVQKIKQEQHLYINNTSEGGPQIKYCLKILDTLEFEMWCNNKKGNYCAVKDSIVPANQFYLTSCLMVCIISCNICDINLNIFQLMKKLVT